MIRRLRHLVRGLFTFATPRKLSESPQQSFRGRLMLRRLVGLAIVFALLAGLGLGGYWQYSQLFQGEPLPPTPEFKDDGNRLPTQEEFDKLAESDPVKMLSACLTRYQREVTGGIHATLQKQERVKGKPDHPEMPPVEVIELWVRGDVPDPETKQTAIEVLMKWRSGAKSVLGAEIRGTLYSQKPEAENGLGKVRTWRPDALAFKLSIPIVANSDPAKDQSRYCMHDAGLYRTLLRTHEAWKARKAAGELKTEYLGKRIVETLGRECHIIKRICPRLEIDAFLIGGTPSTDPKEGFTEVTIYIDAERWLQIGTELYRTEPDGTRVLLGAYYFRDVTLNATFSPDTFTVDELKK